MWKQLPEKFLEQYKDLSPEELLEKLHDTEEAIVSLKKENKGSILRDFNKIYKATTDAKITNALLYVSKPKFPGSFFYFTKNYHVGDINLFYVNLRENIDNELWLFGSNNIFYIAEMRA